MFKRCTVYSYPYVIKGNIKWNYGQADFPKRQIKKLMIFLHGYGTDMYDLFGLRNNFIDILPDTHFISVNAPFKCEFGDGYQWFSLKSMDMNYIY